MGEEREIVSQEDSVRLILEHAIKYGRSKQSLSTGYIHYNYQSHEGEEKNCIPVYENSLFILALFHTRTMENVTEAKELLNKLLYFQSDLDEYSSGNFPVYLHEYPLCKDRLISVNVLTSFYWIHKLYSNILGSELKKRFENSIAKALKQCLKAYKEKKCPYGYSVKIGALAYSFGKALSLPECQSEGEGILKSLSTIGVESFCSQTICSDTLAAIQIAELDMTRSDSDWHFFWKFINETWHKDLGSYLGPALKEYQMAYEPQATLFDLYLSVISKKFSSRSLNPSMTLLQGVLIRPTAIDLVNDGSSFKCEKEVCNGKWFLNKENHFGSSVFVSHKDDVNRNEKGYHELKLIWGSLKKLHSFVCQDGNHVLTHFDYHDNNYELTFKLGEIPQVDDKERSREVIFFFDADDAVEIEVQGKKSNTFKIDDSVTIKLDGIVLKVSFEVLEGEGDFFGHIMRGNRPSQLALKGENRYNAYDWQLFIRTLRRSENCVVKARVSVEKI